MVVGITGGFCSGKSLASGYFRERGYEIVDVDGTGYEALNAREDEVVKAFGTTDRRKLGKIVFADPSERKKLEAIVHPWMIRRVKELLAGKKKVVVDAALLVEMCLHPLCDLVVGVEAEEAATVTRGMERSRLSRGEALQRIRAQIPLKEKSHFVDIIIENNGDISAFREKVWDVIESIERKV